MSKKTIREVRAFNRFYTDMIGLLDRHLLHSVYSLSEARVLFEIAQRSGCQASDIMSAMQIDKSYLSRILKKFEKEKIIARERSREDARAVVLCLTKKGRQEFELLNEASDEQIRGLLSPLTERQCEDLVGHMKSIAKILASPKAGD